MQRDRPAVDVGRRGRPNRDQLAALREADVRELRSYVEPHLAAAGALAAATRANAGQIAELTLGSVARVGATFASGHRINPPFQAPVAAQELARRAAGADDAEPLFVTPDQTRAATARHIHNSLDRIGRETGLRFDTATGWNRYATRPWATFHQLAAGLVTT